MSDERPTLTSHLRLVHFVVVVVSATIMMVAIDVRDRDVRLDYVAIDHIVRQGDRVLGPYWARGALDALVKTSVTSEVRNPKVVGGILNLADTEFQFSKSIGMRAPLAITIPRVSVGSRGETVPKLPIYAETYPGWTWAHYISVSGATRQESLKADLADPKIPETLSVLVGSPHTINGFSEFWNALDSFEAAYKWVSTDFVGVFRVLQAPASGAIPIRAAYSPLANAPGTYDQSKYLVKLKASWLPKDDRENRLFDFTAVSEPVTLEQWKVGAGTPSFYINLFLGLRVVDGKVTEEFELSKIAPGDAIVLFRARYDRLSTRLQDRLLEEAGERGRTPGPFSSSFSALDRYLRKINYSGDYPLELIGALTAVDDGADSAPVELSGIHVSRTEVGFWGVIVLLLAQAYFLLHLQEFLGRMRSLGTKSEFPWIALYRGKAALVGTFASVVAAPVAASLVAAALIQHGSIRSFVLSVCSAVLAFLAARLLLGVRSEITERSVDG